MNSAQAPWNLGWFALTLLAIAVHAQATNIVDPSVSSSSTINASSVRLDGAIFRQELPTSIPPATQLISTNWTVDVFGRDGECIRLDVTSPTAGIGDDDVDFELSVISPNGLFYRNDDRSASDLRPLVKIAALSDGWYTVRVANTFGSGRPGNFTLRYGRYRGGNPNCANPTPGEETPGVEEEATKQREQPSATPSSEVAEPLEGAEQSEGAEESQAL
jgi:hypothetical protein